jgi:hypothetical protein
MLNYTVSKSVKLAAVFVALSISPALASNTDSVAPDKPLTPSTDITVRQGNVVFGHIPLTEENVGIMCEGVNVTIKRVADGDDIHVLSSCPSHWNVRGHNIRQVAFATTQKGISIRADAGGSILTVNGRLYPMPTDANGNLHGLQISQKDGKVTINGQVVEPIAGSDVPGNCTGIDSLEVQVPNSYRGGLFLYANGAAKIAVDSWQGGSLIANLSGQSNLTIGSLLDLNKAVFDIHGEGKADVRTMFAQMMVANIDGKGSVQIDGGTAKLSNATVSNGGAITLHGKFNNLKKAVTGGGTIDVLP